jgi:hypothetical protein
VAEVIGRGRAIDVADVLVCFAEGSVVPGGLPMPRWSGERLDR